MRKDYARYSARSKHSLESGWVKRLLLVIFIIFVLGLPSYGFYFYKTHSFQLFTLWIAKAKGFFHHEKSDANNGFVKKETPLTATDPEIHFDFYTELSAAPLMKPVKEKSMNKNQLEVISIQQKSTSIPYIVQLGLFKNESEANKLRLSMLLEGVESEIIKTQAGYYRLQQGPYPTLADAEKTQSSLKNKGIVSLIHHADVSSSAHSL